MHRGNDNISEEEARSVMLNQAPGAPNFKVLGFQGGHHGKFLTTLSASSYNNLSRNFNSGVTRHNWPIAPFPNIKWPYDDNLTYNRNEENRCVEEAERMIKEAQNSQPVAAMIIEPLQVQSGVRYASSQFYVDLIDVCYRNNVTFICDETQTCGWASGRPFMHTSWNSEKPAHIVTFAGRLQMSGMFMKAGYRTRHASQICSTWNGDAVKLLTFARLFYLVHNKDWIDTHSSQFFMSIRAEMQDTMRKTCFKINNLRGIGKIFAFDVEHQLLRDELIIMARNAGFKVHSMGAKTIGFTPSLLFAEFHFKHFTHFLKNAKPTTQFISM